jgi:pSer/pThr/pTyr-binding forkhead associated (FHA) protein
MNNKKTAWLEGVSGHYRGRRVPLANVDTLLGRSGVCDIHLPGQDVSRQHAIIRFANGNYFLQDQGSALGTILNGRRINASALQDGDQISIGNTRFIFHASSAASRGMQMVPAGSAGMYPAASPGVSRPYMEQEEAIARGAAKAIAQNKSFTGKAWLTWAMYYVGLFLVGLIFNIVYLNEASQVEKITGQAPPGKGCLVYLLVVQLIGLVILIIAIIASGGAILSFMY